MSEETLTITLAGKDYTIRPLTIGQLEALHVGMVEAVPADAVGETRRFWRQKIDMIAAALSVDHPEMTAEEIGKLRLGKVKAVTKAADDILRFAGLLPEGDTSPGETQAGAAPSLTGAPSSPDSRAA